MTSQYQYYTYTVWYLYLIDFLTWLQLKCPGLSFCRQKNIFARTMATTGKYLVFAGKNCPKLAKTYKTHISKSITFCRVSAFNDTSRVAIEGKSSVCLICTKYRIIILNIIIISLGQNIIIAYCKHITHACIHARASMCTHSHAHTPPSRRSGYCYSMSGAQP